jgi:nitric oxide reductase large subunit
MVVFLLVMALEKAFSLSKSRYFNLFFWHYNGGLVLTTGVMLVHGIMQVQGVKDSAMIAGIAGLGHIILTVGLGFLFAALYQRAVKEK